MRKPESKETHDARNARLNPVRSECEKIVGGRKAYNKLPKEERLALRAEAKAAMEEMQSKPQGLGKIKRAVRSVLPFVSRGTGGSKSMTTHTQSDKKGEKVDEGWVYCIGFPEIPNRCKIGRTWPDGMPSIMRDARRFGRAVELAKRWSNDVDKSETAVHTILIEYNLRKLGYTDVGREVFECSVDDFHRAFAEHLCDQFEEEEGEDSISEG